MRTLLPYVISFVVDFAIFTIAGLLAAVALKWGWSVSYPLFPVVLLATIADNVLGLLARGLAMQVKRGLDLYKSQA